MSEHQYEPLRALSLRHQVTIVLLTLLLLLSLVGLLASISVALIFTPKPEMKRWMPEGIMCATCGEIPSVEMRRRVGCQRIVEEGGGTVSYILF